jgi:hypothetical protein
MKEIVIRRTAIKALVDDEDYAKVMALGPWRIDKRQGYILRSCTVLDEYMHRLILPPPRGLVIDHINGIKHDNRKVNLRSVTYAQNNQNNQKKSKVSAFLGVSLHTQNGNWVAQINKASKHYHIGVFPTAHLAALAYDEKAKELYGENATLNFPRVPKAAALNYADREVCAAANV